MNISNDLTHVINQTSYIENLLDQILINFSCPRKDAFSFFWGVLLDSSIMPLGSKVKVAMAISQECGYKLNQNSLHSIISYRNAFAHNSLNSHPVLMVGKTPDDDEIHYTLRIVKNTGKTELKKRKDALEEFNKAFSVAKDSLMPLREITMSLAQKASAGHVAYD